MAEAPEMLEDFLSSLQLSEYWELLREAGATFVSDLTSCSETVAPPPCVRRTLPGPT